MYVIQPIIEKFPYILNYRPLHAQFRSFEIWHWVNLATCLNLSANWGQNTEITVSTHTWDALERQLAELIFDQNESVRCAVPKLCSAHARTSVHYLMLALSSAASALEDNWPIADRLNQRHLLDLYRAGAAVSADIALHGVLGQNCATCGQLLSYWQTDPDPYFDVAGTGNAFDMRHVQ